MSFSVFSGDSDVYVYADIIGCVTCCGCIFEDEKVEPYTDIFGIEQDWVPHNAELHFPDEVVAHMQKHVEAGHKVPVKLLNPGLYEPRDFAPWVGFDATMANLIRGEEE